MTINQGSSQNHALPSSNQLGSVTNSKPQDWGVEKNEDWYLAYGRYVASKYNHVVPQLGYIGNSAISGGAGFSNSPSGINTVSVRWATNVLLNEAYCKAQQNDTLFKFMATDETNNQLPTKFIKDPTPYIIFKHILGNMRKSVATLPSTVYANAISNEALRDKNLSINMAKMIVDHAEDFLALKESGVEFSPMGKQEFGSVEEVESAASNMQDAMAEFFTSQVKDFLYSQNWEEKCGKMAEYLIPAYFCRVELIPNGTEMSWNIIRPAQCIWDNTFDDELGRRQRFQGIVENWTPAELVEKYKFTSEEKLELQSLASEIPNNGQAIMQLNNMSGATDLVWWGMMSRTPTVAVVKTRFLSYDENTGRETWYKVDIIGNRWAKNYGPCDNLCLNKDGSINTPFLDFIPEMSYGVNFSIIDKMQQISGLITGLNAKNNFFIARGKGKVPVFLGSKFPTGTNQIQLLRDIAAGLVFIDDVDMDDLQREQSKKIADILDLSIANEDVNTIRGEILYWENKLRELASIPLVALGAQTQIVGAKVQSETVEQSTYGLYPLYHGFMLYINQILNVEAQMKKNIISTFEDKKELKFQVSPREFKYFEVTKYDSLPDIQIYLSQADQITEADKAHIQAMAEREASIPNGWFNTLDAAELLTMSTKTEMINYLRYRKMVWDKKQEEMQAAAEQQAQMQQEANMANAENVAEIQGENTLANTAMKGQQDIKKTAFEAAIQPETNNQQ